MNEQIKHWKGEFGDSYIQRNSLNDESINRTRAGFSIIFENINEDLPEKILEVGSNIGINIKAIQGISNAEICAVEPNQNARNYMKENGVLSESNIFDATANELPFDDDSFNMVFTSCVLIHVPEELLKKSYEEIYRVSNKYILCMEYFSPTSETKKYRGYDDLLYKRDYGGLWMDWYPDLEHIANGFFWKRTTGFDDVNWWLFKKK